MARLVIVLAVCVALFASADARRKGHHHHHHDSAPEDIPTMHRHAAAAKDSKLESEAADLKSMMEGVKAQTDSQSGVPATAAAPKEETPLVVQDDAAKDDGLLKEAAKMQQMMFSKSRKLQKTAKATEASEESRKARAARWFAEHNMGGMGKMLGETENAADAAKPTAATLMKQALKLDKEDQAVKQDFPDISLDDDDDEDSAQKAQWAKVDELRRKNALRGA